jgi:hypothetical protein
MVALPEDSRTREHLEWVAEQVIEAGGTALLFRAEAMSPDDERTVAQAMSSARADEYGEIAESAAAALSGPAGELGRALQRLRREQRRVKRRDYFPPAEREEAVAAIGRLAEAAQTIEPAVATSSPRRSP